MPDAFDFPFHMDPRRGRTAVTDREDHIRDMIQQVLFTSPGERVNRPDFGCGINQLVFLPNSDVLAAATQFLVHGALSRWLEDVIIVHAVDITPYDSTLMVRVIYTVRATGDERDEQFTAPQLV